MSKEDKQDIDNLKHLIKSNNLHRGLEIKKELKTVLADIEKTKIPPLLNPIIELYVLSSNYGITKRLGKEKTVEGRYYAKIWLDSPKVGAQNEGLYRNKHGVHFNTISSAPLTEVKKDSPFSTILHETVHYDLNQIYARKNPQPELPWNELKDLIAMDVKEANPDTEGFTSLFKEIFTYKEELQISELLPRLVEYVLIHQHLPLPQEGFTHSAAKIKSLFHQFIIRVTTEIGILQDNITDNKAVSKLDLYQAITQADGIPAQHIQKDIRTQRNMGFYPLHIAAQFGYATLTQWLLDSKNASIDDKDKFGNLALHIALENGNASLAAFYIKQMPLELLFSKNEYHKSVFKLAKDHCPTAKYALMERTDYLDRLMKSVQNEAQLKQAADFFIEAINNASSLTGIKQIVSVAKGALLKLSIPDQSRYLQDIEQSAIIKMLDLSKDEKSQQKSLPQAADFFIEAINNASSLTGIKQIVSVANEALLKLSTPDQSRYLQDIEQSAIIKMLDLPKDEKSLQESLREVTALIHDEKQPEKLDGMIAAAKIGLGHKTSPDIENSMQQIESHASTKIYSLFNSRRPIKSDSQEEPSLTPSSSFS